MSEQDPYQVREQQNDSMSRYLIDSSHKKVANSYYHYFDPSLVRDAPDPYHNSQDNIHRRDYRDSLNNRLDGHLFGVNQIPYPQRPKQEQPKPQQQYANRIQNHIPEKNYQASRQEYLESKRQKLSQENKQRILDQIYQEDPNADPFYQVNYQTSRVSNKYENNERMQNYIGLPKSMPTPINHFSRGANLAPQPDTHLLNINQNSRQNFKDNHNQRLQELVPLSKTASFGMNSFENALREQPRNNQNARDQINPTRQQASEIRRMRENIQNLGMNHQPREINVEYPVDTRS